MSWTDDEIDALFKETAKHFRTPPYQDSFFDEIEPLLPVQKKRGRRLFWLLGSLLVTGSSGVLFVLITRNEPAGSGNRAAGAQMANHIVLQTKPAEQINPVNGGQAQSGLNAITEPDKEQRQYPEKNRDSQFKNTAHELEDDASTGNKPQHEIQETLSISDKPETDYLASETDPDVSRTKETEDETEEKQNLRMPEEEPFIPSGLHLLSLHEPFAADFKKEIQALSLPGMNRKHYLSLETGIGFTENFIKMDNASQHPMPSAQLGLSYRFGTKKLFYSAGLSWANFRPNNLILNRQSKVYGFDVNYYNQAIDYKWITILELPLVIGKKFGNQSISFGAAPSLVLGSMIDFTNTQNDIVTEQDRVYGNLFGLKRYAASVSLAYDLSIAQNLDLGVKISNLIVNPLDDSKFIGQLNKNPFQAQITLKKHFRIR